MVDDSELRSPEPHLSACGEEEIEQYRALSGSALIGLILGLLSCVAVIDPWLAAVPIVGIFCSVSALWRISRNTPVLVGRTVARIGLGLSIFFLIAPPAHRYVHRRLIRDEARQFAAAWFDMLADGEPHKADQLTLDPQYRQPLDDRLWAFYGEGPHWRTRLEEYVAEPAVRALIELGDDARVRYYETSGQRYHGGREQVIQTYAVTYDDSEGKKTFFVELQLHRHRLESGQANWQIVRLNRDFRPAGL